MELKYLSWRECIILIAAFSKSAWIFVSTNRDFSRTLRRASGICFDRVLPKRVSCNLISYLVQLGRWTVSPNFSENTLTFLPVGTGTEDPMGTKISQMDEPGEGLEELASFWLLVETNFLPLMKLISFKLKVNSLLPPPATSSGQGVPTKLVDCLMQYFWVHLSTCFLFLSFYKSLRTCPCP